MALVFNEAEAWAENAAKGDDPRQVQQDQTDDGAAVPAHTRSRGGRTLPTELHHVEIVHKPEEDDQGWSSCESPMQDVCEKTSEQLDIITARVQVITHVRKTCACKACDSTSDTVSLPPQTNPKSLASPGMLAPVASAKASAKLYSLIEMIEANVVEPYRYLRKIYTELPTANSLEEVETLLPFE